MKVLILGGSGPCGILTCQYALQAGHKLVVYARNPSKHLPDIATHDDVQIVSGQLKDVSALRSALSGCDAVISSLGPPITRDQETHVTNGYKSVLEAMRAEGIKRIIALGTPSMPDSFDIHTWQKDVRAFGDLISRADDLEWTIVRVPFLTTSPGKAYAMGYVGDGKVGWFLRREAYAQFMVDELEKRDWVKKMPLISNA